MWKKFRSASYFSIYCIQRGDVILDAEQHAARVHELDIDILEHATPEPRVARQIHRLLRRACAFDRHRRLGEQRATLFHLLHQLPGVGRKIVAVVRRHAIASQGLFQTFDFVPIQLEARTHNQPVVFHHATAIEDDGVVLRLERGDGGLDPLHAARDQGRHRLGSILRLENAAADHGPARLVIVNIRRIDDRDGRDRLGARLQAGRDSDARRTAADDHDVILSRRPYRSGSCPRSRCGARHRSCHSLRPSLRRECPA